MPDQTTPKPDAVFEVAVNITLGHEKTYVFDPEDPGGETNYGISKRSYPDIDISALDIPLARRIYYQDFWRKPKLNMLATIAPDLAIKAFDLGVNCGTRTAVKFLQRAVNTVCCGSVPAKRKAAWRQKVAALINGKPLAVDGVLGPITISVIYACPYDVALMSALKGEAYKHYEKGKALYVPGWLTRLET